MLAGLASAFCCPPDPWLCPVPETTAVARLGRVDKIEIFVIPAEAGIYEDVHQVIIGLKTTGFRS